MRGEPRGSHKQGESWEGRGHCVDCNQCVVVCPQGIDIRNGLQVECIACGLCIDACNDIMQKVGLPPGLIRYDTTHNIASRAKGLAEKLHILRPRTVYYSILLSLVAGAFLYGLLTRDQLTLNAIHDRNPLFVRLSDGRIRNGYTIKILNKTNENRSYNIIVKGIDAALIIGGAGGATPENLLVEADKVGEFQVFVVAQEKAVKSGRADIQFMVKDNATGTTITHPSMFVSKNNGGN